MPSVQLQRPKRRKLAISLTSLIDVVFILLVFFMLASKFEKEAHITVILPSPSKSNSQSPPQDTHQDVVKVRIVGNNLFQIKGNNLDRAAFIALLQAQQQDHFVISVSKAARTQDLVAFMDIADSLTLENYKFDFSEAK